MIHCEMEKLTPSARRLVRDRVAGRIHAKDAGLYAFDQEAQECASHFMGWADLASNPPYAPEDIQRFADEVVAGGIKTVVLIGQGGSTQAPMTITKYNKVDDSNRVDFKVIDSDSPVRVREIVAAAVPQSTLVITASKSGGTLEPRVMLAAVRKALFGNMPADEQARHLVAITDPGSALDKQAHDEGWLAVFPGEPSVGGRFSALSVFGLLPAALAGIDITRMLACAAQCEARCSEDAIDNPAIGLAAFLYDNYLEGRDKFCFLTPKRGRVFGLWIEQLVAESLGKNGKGILPNIEIDSLLLTRDNGDRSVIMYETKNDLWDERKNFEMSFSYIHRAIPRLRFHIDSVDELAEHFVMWEYAIAMCGYLMEVCPFDQPDVACAKAKVLELLSGEAAGSALETGFHETFTDKVKMGEAEVRASDALGSVSTMREALVALFGAIKPGDYFALDAFLPFTGEYRREALEIIRHGVAEYFGVPSCLEVGPRYLHSTGQMQKGGPNNGVFLLLSAEEMKDIPLDAEAPSLGKLAKVQAIGDWATLNSRNRRCVHLHLPDNTGVTLRALAEVCIAAMREAAQKS